MNELMDFFKAAPFLGDATIATVVVVLILTGKLVTRRQLLDVMQERDEWRTAYNSERDVTAEIRRQNGELLETARVSERLLTSFKERSGP